MSPTYPQGSDTAVTIDYMVIKSHNTTHENRTPKRLACFQ